MSEPIRDVETAVRERGAMPVPVGTAALTAEQRAAIAELLGDARPATAGLVEQLAESVRDRLAHDHSTQREDWFCLNLTSFMGERMGPVLRRLLDVEARVDELAAKAKRGAAHSKHLATCLVARTEDLIAAEADGITRRIAPTQALREDDTDGEPTLTVYRASWDTLPLGHYTTAQAAREHCEKRALRDLPSISLDWIEDEEAGVAELVGSIGEEERSLGYVVTAVDVASEYDEEADE
ncbi:hypothetical protein [Streptomyces dubilierae]|uniref:DUF222 domain-containing protein n=1 Tax=Streptomyces dubilierae TaxID=3075533 RepID=A0ABU2P6V5_9ACTN|nr:hypothetical protein [Streptomyces sp. DSM 41921]MDT0387878.1 hypothetical protein [Streptomyces sp. DSM 41921]